MDERAARKQFLDELVREGLFILTGIPGFYGRGSNFERIAMAFNRIIDGFSEQDGAERIYFPPLIPRTTLEKSAYLESMPHLAGTVHSFEGSDAAHRQMLERVAGQGEWGEFMKMTDLALAPAACYPLYPTCRGELAGDGRLVDLGPSYVFRHEPSDDPARLQMFRQREIVRLGAPEVVCDWRELWMERGRTLLSGLGLEVKVEEASDPFFGRGARMMAATQRQQKLKFELQVPICSEENPTAVTSFNYHREHFGRTFGINAADGSVAHTACLGFGAERITLALLKTHGLSPEQWPLSVRKQLWP